jgi:tRNA G18 (ribose-2'-O)-methylase SpoU
MEEKFWNVGSVLRIAALVGVIAIVIYQKRKDKQNG